MKLGLGCATFGREITEEEAFAVMDHAFGLGIRFFDTAEAYGGGQARLYRKNTLGADDVREVSGEMHSSEKIVGRWLESRGVRREVVLATKVTTNFTRDHVLEAVESSLERLRTDCVDVYFYHAFDANTPVEAAAEAMDDVVRRGRAREAGCSNYTAAQLEEALGCAMARNLTRFRWTECNYNLVAREIEGGLLPAAARHGVKVVTYSPLAAGFLMGKYTPDRSQLPKGTRFDVIPGHADVYFSERNFRIVERLRALAARAGMPVERLAMAWVLRNPALDVVLVGARKPAHLDNAVAAAETTLDPAWVAEIDQWE